MDEAFEAQLLRQAGMLWGLLYFITTYSFGPIIQLIQHTRTQNWHTTG